MFDLVLFNRIKTFIKDRTIKICANNTNITVTMTAMTRVAKQFLTCSLIFLGLIRRNVLPHVRSFFLVRIFSPTCTVHLFIFEWSVPIFPHVQSIPICSTQSMKKLMRLMQGPQLLVSANTVPTFLTGGAGVKPLLGSENTVQCQVRLG